MELAFLILAHTDLPQLKHLCVKLSGYGDVYIHVDGKTSDSYVVELKEFLRSIKGKYYVLDKRVNVHWGAYSQVLAERSLLDAAFGDDNKVYDRVFLLSGLCYPLFSKEKLLRYCEENKEAELMTAYNVTQGNVKRQRNKICLYHFFRDIPIRHKSMIRRFIIGGTMLTLKYFGVRRKPFLTINGKRWDVFFSSQWFGLTGKCASYVLEQMKYNKTLENYFMSTYVPDELVIPTIVMNSEYGKTAQLVDRSDLVSCSMLRYMHYTDHVWEYDEHDYDVLIQSNKPFIRKLVSCKSKKLIEMIDNLHEQEQN